ncbi:MAG: 50S ribosomal protein L21 [Candidatus Omnitrophica bacterium]|nr:50S ribosomal protein L21 [Candidatus Omnitrophota bacterium]
MYAIIELNGAQVKVGKDEVFTVNNIKDQKEKNIRVDTVLFGKDGEKYYIGQPYVKGAYVECEIVGDKRARKVIAFHYRERKSSQSKTGHRQDLTELKVKEIVLK